MSSRPLPFPPWPLPSPDEADPVLVAACGDWHKNHMWAQSMIRGTAPHFPAGSPRLFLHVGDLIFWDHEDFLRILNQELEDQDAWLWFTEGNHDDHEYLRALPRDDLGRGIVRNRIRWLPRNHRWKWHGKTWLAMGGAVSIDRAWQQGNGTWSPLEAITFADAFIAQEAGPADVMVCHDVPDFAELKGVPPVVSGNWLKALPDCERHRGLLGGIADAVQPSLILNGHYHSVWDQAITRAWGQVRCIGLDCDGAPWNTILLNTGTLEPDLRYIPGRA